jgi:hypothetical protein
VKKLIRTFIHNLPYAIAIGAMMPPVVAQNSNVSKYLTAQCKAASFARHPAGTMATTMRNMAITRCIKNKGYLE